MQRAWRSGFPFSLPLLYLLNMHEDEHSHETHKFNTFKCPATVIQYNLGKKFYYCYYIPPETGGTYKNGEERERVNPSLRLEQTRKPLFSLEQTSLKWNKPKQETAIHLDIVRC